MKPLFVMLLVIVMLLASFILLPGPSNAASEDHIPLEKARINIRDHASLQRGAKMYMNYCSGCHSLKYMRYSRMAKDIGIVDQRGRVAKQLVKDNLIFTDAKIHDTIQTAIQPQDAKQWFGRVPSDLSLIARSRGADWLYTYLISFYSDSKRMFGTNNWLFPDVAMPNVLINLQGMQKPAYIEKAIKVEGSLKSKKVKEIDHLSLVKAGSMTPAQFDQSVNDLVNFLVYVSEPAKLSREKIGLFVIIFVIILSILTYLLKCEYWKDVKKDIGKASNDK